MHWLVLISALIHQAWLHHRRGWFDPFAVEALLDFGIVLIVFVGTLVDPASAAMMEGNLDFGTMVWGGQVALYLGLHAGLGWGSAGSAASPRDPTASPSRESGELGRAVITGVVVVYAAAVGVILFQSAQLAGGLQNWILGSRTDVAASAAAGGVGALAYNFAMAGQTALMVATASAWRRERWGEGWLWYGAVVLGLFLIFTTRFQFVVLALLPILYFHYRRRRVSVGWLLAGVVPIVALMAMLNVLRGGGVTGLGSGIKVEDLLAGSTVVAPTYLLNPVVQIWEAHEQRRFELEYGLNYLYVFVTPIPRALWPEKPLTSFSNRLTEQMQGSQLNALGGIEVSTFTVWGEGFGQFGLLGAVFNLGIFGYVFGRFLREAWRRPDWILAGGFFTILGATYLREGVASLAILGLNTVGFLLVLAWAESKRGRGGP